MELLNVHTLTSTFRVFHEPRPEVFMNGISIGDSPWISCLIHEQPNGSWIGWSVPAQVPSGTFNES